MPFQRVETKVDFPALERGILELWSRTRAFERLREKNRGQPRWSFLDGPITANNPMGVHHAWGRSYKDAYQRYFAMTGHELRYQNGFDCQGLWVEVEVEKELGLRIKRDIENLVPGNRDASIATFVERCKARVDRFARIQTQQSIRLGYWMNWDVTDEDWAKAPGARKSYFTMSEENNDAIWRFLKECHRRGLVYRGYDVMPWCGRCGAGISEQELKEGYRLVEHRAAFVRFPLVDRPGEHLLVWTTTPWTLTSNVGAAINPRLTYLQVKLRDQIWYVAEGAFKRERMESGVIQEAEGEAEAATLESHRRDWVEGVPHLKSIEQIFKEKAGKDGYSIVGKVPGDAMLGWAYAGPFDDLPAQAHPYGYPGEIAKVVQERGWSPATTAVAAHRVISGGHDVTDDEGTGIVHVAPGCGQIDFEWGKKNGLPPVAPIGDDGVFHEGFGPLSGKSASDPTTAEAIFEDLKRRDRLLATERYVHRYPHCWRCKSELLYRLVDEWFIDMGPPHTAEGLRGEIMAVVDQATFLPAGINGRARERDWLWNMGDWMISKKRFWGLALPIWVDEKTGDFEVIGSREELKSRALDGWGEFEGHSPHRPYIDRVRIRNPKTGNPMSRIPDVGNPWLDAGIVAFSTMGWDSDPASWAKWFPADFVVESFPGQFRNWFYSLLTMSTVLAGRAPFKTLLGHALVRDQDGREMHKSEGNAIEFIAAADEGFTLTDRASGKAVAYPPMGADVMRWMFCRHDPQSNLNFGPEPANEVRARFHLKLWNCYAFFCNYARLDAFDPTGPEVPPETRPDIDRWILSDLQVLVGNARKSFESFDLMRVCLEAERFVDDELSNWYVRRNRRRFWKADAGTDQLAAYQTLYRVLRDLARLVAPIVPFLSESIWQNLRTKLDPASVHLAGYPAPDPALHDPALSADMERLLALVALGSRARNAAGIKVRQPLAELRIQPAGDDERRAVERFSQAICEEINVKRVTVHDPASDGPLLRTSVKPDLKVLGPKMGPRLREIQAALAKADPSAIAAAVSGGGSFPLPLGNDETVPLAATDLLLSAEAAEGWVGALERGNSVALDVRLTPELVAEGLAREAIRQIQELRKAADLAIEDRIELRLHSPSAEVMAAIETHRDSIANETLTTAWAKAPLGATAHAITARLDGKPLEIELRKIRT